MKTTRKSKDRGDNEIASLIGQTEQISASVRLPTSGAHERVWLAAISDAHMAIWSSGNTYPLVGVSISGATTNSANKPADMCQSRSGHESANSGAESTRNLCGSERATRRGCRRRIGSWPILNPNFKKRGAQGQRKNRWLRQRRRHGADIRRRRRKWSPYRGTRTSPRSKTRSRGNEWGGRRRRCC